MGTFKTELRALINRFSRESDSNTPDFVLAQYMTACLDAYNAAVQQRESWHGRDAEYPPASSLDCGCSADRHGNFRNMLEGAAERDGRVCKLGWPV